MTTNVAIGPSGHHVLVVTDDYYVNPDTGLAYSHHEEVVVPPGGAFPITYVTTTRSITVRDLEPTDPRTGYKPGKAKVVTENISLAALIARAEAADAAVGS
jgi:hypothetical protein